MIASRAFTRSRLLNFFFSYFNLRIHMLFYSFFFFSFDSICVICDGAPQSIACGFLAQFMTFEMKYKKLNQNLLICFSWFLVVCFGAHCASAHFNLAYTLECIHRWQIWFFFHFDFFLLVRPQIDFVLLPSIFKQ